MTDYDWEPDDDVEYESTMTYNGIRLNCTCGACPEQYDAYKGDEEVGYLRLRHGYFRVNCGDVTVYEAFPKGDGCFDDDERDYWLLEALKAIDEHLSHSSGDKEYVIDMRVRLRVRDVADDESAVKYIEDFAVGLQSLAESDDEYDDHYRIDNAEFEWSSFHETYKHYD